MAGIYLHIPFCRKRCHYCDFFKSTDLSQKARLLEGLKQELKSRASEIASQEINTIYLGGGTPSVLQTVELESIISLIKGHYRVTPDAEITLEANPDDLTPEYLQALRRLGFNRLSMGIQSFDDADLQLMNRRHDASQAFQSVQWARQAGFSNLSIDLIYGLPNQTLQAWEQNVQKALKLDVQHISAYHLTYHQGTVFYNRLKKGLLKELPDELSLAQFNLLVEQLSGGGFEHYEISNFCKPGYYSRHNSAYWNNQLYLGIGPSAHSFDQKTRRWNVSSIARYLDGLENGKSYWESETLSEQDRYNDLIITGLRTTWGIAQDQIRASFDERYFTHFLHCRDKYLRSGEVEIALGKVRISSQGWFVSDKIMADFMVVESS